MPGFYGWMADCKRKDSQFLDSQGEAGKSTSSSKNLRRSGKHLCVFQKCFTTYSYYVVRFRFFLTKLLLYPSLLIVFCSSHLDPSSLVAGDMALVHQAIMGRTLTGRGRIFTGTSTRLEKQGSPLSTLSPPKVTSTRVMMWVEGPLGFL